MGEETYICVKCSEEKSWTAFDWGKRTVHPARSDARGYRDSTCRACRNTATMARRRQKKAEAEAYRAQGEIEEWLEV